MELNVRDRDETVLKPYMNLCIRLNGRVRSSVAMINHFIYLRNEYNGFLFDHPRSRFILKSKKNLKTARVFFLCFFPAILFENDKIS